ncbi:hypothetical protein [Priestia aryabhattai]|uniref:hypothetical protein n=1 Tax=Priestia aryabhattai TaxID=412384 RepID=UPI003CF213D4
MKMTNCLLSIKRQLEDNQSVKENEKNIKNLEKFVQEYPEGTKIGEVREKLKNK